MRPHKVQILDPNTHRQALYAHYIVQAGYEVVKAYGRNNSGVVLADCSYIVLSLPLDEDRRMSFLGQLRSQKSHKPLFVLDSNAFVHEQFKGLALVGHINRNALSLSETIGELLGSLKNI